MTVNNGGQFMTVNQNDVHIRSTVFKHNNENIPIMELYSRRVEKTTARTNQKTLSLICIATLALYQNR